MFRLRASPSLPSPCQNGDFIFLHILKPSPSAGESWTLPDPIGDGVLGEPGEFSNSFSTWVNAPTSHAISPVIPLIKHLRIKFLTLQVRTYPVNKQA